jgi:hypothetical protein
MGEAKNVGVVCHTCKGIGKETITISYTEFSKRQESKQINWVIQNNPGIRVGAGKNEDGEVLKLEDFGGMSYKDWNNGKPFPPESEMRKFVCPAWWYQGVAYDKSPHWRTGEVQCSGCGSFSSCKFFLVKEKCWKRWDKEFGDK